MSVIVPVYNVDKFLERCLDSILAQTYRVGEIICVNDGSTDKCADILEKYKMRFPCIKVLHKDNGGLVSARKAGLQLATGKYVTYVDSDDWIEKDMYEVLVDMLKQEGADIVTSGCIRDYGTHQVVEEENVIPGLYEAERLKKEIWENMIDTDVFFRSNISMHIYNKIYKRSLLLLHQMEVDNRINVAEDAACVYPCILGAGKVVVSGKNFYHYCIRTNSIMGNRRTDEFQRISILFEYLKKKFSLQLFEISNIMSQLKMLETYVQLLQMPDKVIYSKDDMLYPFGRICKDDKLVIYGSGRFGVALKGALEKLGYKNIVAWIDKKADDIKNIRQVSYINQINYDKIILAVLLADVANEIKTELLGMGIGKDKIYTIDAKILKETVAK